MQGQSLFDHFRARQRMPKIEPEREIVSAFSWRIISLSYLQNWTGSEKWNPDSAKSGY